MSFDQALMETMRTTVVGNVESVTRYSIDADSKGGAIWVTKPNTGKNQNVLGNEIIKIKMPFEMFPQIQAMNDSGDITLPQVMEILCDIDMGGQNRAVLTAVSIRKYIPETNNTSTAKQKSVDNQTKPSA